METFESSARELYLHAAVYVTNATKEVWAAAEKARENDDYAKKATKTAKASESPMDKAEAKTAQHEARESAAWAVSRLRIALDEIKRMNEQAEETLRDAEAALKK
jgi:hypothetical protein